MPARVSRKRSSTWSHKYQGGLHSNLGPRYFWFAGAFTAIRRISLNLRVQALTTTRARLAVPSGYFCHFVSEKFSHSIVFDKTATMMASNAPPTAIVFSQSLKHMHRATINGTPRHCYHLTQPIIRQSAPPKRCFDVHEFTYGVVCGLFFISMFSVCLSVSFNVGILEALPVRNVLTNQVQKNASNLPQISPTPIPEPQATPPQITNPRFLIPKPQTPNLPLQTSTPPSHSIRASMV
jgi:hypothetical protein